MDAYNKFAEEYNKYMADRKDKPTCYLLEKIDPADNWMDLATRATPTAI